ncbi:undecaprenyldiphospho-muramoylpentapeptide beta-N-acetylglucosaminyltransferase [Bowmanella denitrificans]|uniref:UDP-N-acetylglucosamine--N-acetylmuramyl-(pentapeptide) pyrophosphoryl-undecaprenol N-acetylglucosamine transferase n=1 Tax=Bowmanella denitrificans TaxID=366582 RepID=A0ABN0X412_9ALTE
MSGRIMIMAGGTGGHVFPGLAVADWLAAQGWQIHWLGTAQKMEAKVVPAAGYPISFLSISGVRGNGLLRLLKAPFSIVHAIWQARRAIKVFKPDVVLGMGGFASGPGGMAAWLCGIPLLVHEQNAVPGMTNKLLSRLARKVLSGFDQTFKPGAKVAWVGNPVRRNIMPKPYRQIEGKVHVLVVGGSLGARALNEQLPAHFAGLQNIEIRHQCGGGRLAEATDAYRQHMGQQNNWQVEEFIQDMGQAYAWADLVICRSGALTVSEIASSGLAAIFVPLPHAVDDHQTCNAQVLVRANAAILAPQPSLTGEQFKQTLMQLLHDPAKLVEMGQRALSQAKPDATEKVAQYCKQLAEQQA